MSNTKSVSIEKYILYQIVHESNKKTSLVLGNLLQYCFYIFSRISINVNFHGKIPDWRIGRHFKFIALNVYE